MKDEEKDGGVVFRREVVIRFDNDASLFIFNQSLYWTIITSLHIEMASYKWYVIYIEMAYIRI